MEQTVGAPTAPTGNVGRDLSNKSRRNPSLFGKAGDKWHVWEMDPAWEHWEGWDSESDPSRV